MSAEFLTNNPNSLRNQESLPGCAKEGLRCGQYHADRKFENVIDLLHSGQHEHPTWKQFVRSLHIGFWRLGSSVPALQWKIHPVPSGAL
jgi:hypothetical protein